jgi:3-hydroxyisobutyrate dehydrogenase
MIDVISKGAAACWTLDNLAPRINQADYEPGFMVDHFVKDLGIALAEADRLELALPGTQLASQLYAQLQSMGQGKRGTQSLILALKKLNDIN